MKLALAAVISVAALLTACGSTPIAEPTPESTPESKVVAPVTVQTQSTPQTATPTQTQAIAAHLDPASPISQNRSVYFDFDDYTIKSQYKNVIELHAAYLKANPKLQIRLEGHADERGGREYNLSLGQKRSESVKRALSTLGAGSGQQEAVSFGKEKPKAMGHDEAAWAENRRVDIVYTQK